MNKKLLPMAFVSLLAAATFSACSNDNDDDEGGATGAITELTIDVDNAGSIDADTVKVVIRYGGWSFVAASIPYPKGKFTLKLPATVDEKYLYDDLKDMPDGVMVSDSVRLAMAWVDGYKSGVEVGNFWHGTAEWEGDLYYANGDVTVTGSYEGWDLIRKYDLHLKKGWNMIYYKTAYETKTTTETTTAPSGAKWLWMYDPD
jgi:hypothetical protein